MRNKTISIALALILCMLPCTLAQAFTLTVESSDGGAVGDYRWLVEEDTTFYIDPTNPAPNPTDPPTVRFHTSYMPVRASGDTSDLASPAPGDITLDPDKRYFVSVTPFSGYTIGGGQLVGNGSVTVNVNSRTVPTARMSIFASKTTML